MAKTYSANIRFNLSKLKPSKRLIARMITTSLSALIVVFVLFSTGLFQLFEGWLITYKVVALIVASIYLQNLFDIMIGGKDIL